MTRTVSIEVQVCFASLSIVFKIHFSPAFLLDIPILNLHLQLSPQGYSAIIRSFCFTMLPYVCRSMGMLLSRKSVFEQGDFRTSMHWIPLYWASPSSRSVYSLPPTSISPCISYATRSGPKIFLAVFSGLTHCFHRFLCTFIVFDGHNRLYCSPEEC